MYSCRNVLALDAMTALYCRLSVDDANDGDSNSIQNQKKILLNYAQENGYTNYQFFVDDGYSGTTFERPDFKRMIEGIKAGIIKRVIIKDMSRFGRDYLQVGMYTEIMFAEYDIHFIAVNDGVDSQKGENDLTPFRNLFNEWYARDCSKKQRAVKRMKGMAGERISTHAPYGYLNGEDGKLVVDEETAPVVRLIFDLCVQGFGIGKIASELTRRNIPTPGTVEYLKQTVKFATEHENEFAQCIMKRTLTKQQEGVKTLQKMLAAKEHRIKELDGIIKKLYEDNFSGKLSDERYMIFSREYEDEQHTLKAEVEELKSQIEEQTSKAVNINSFLTVAKKYTSFETLTPGMLHELVEKIVVHEGDKSSGHRIQKIDIYYSFVGDLETSHVVAQRTLKDRKAA